MRTSWRRLSEGDVKGVVRPFDRDIHRFRMNGMSLAEIASLIGKRKSYVQHRLLRIAARENEEVENHT